MARPELAPGWTRPTSFIGRPPAIPAEQLVLFPRKALWEYPAPSGCDIHKLVGADNGKRYFLKLDKGDVPVRANEWIAYRLASYVGIDVPRADFIQTFNGDIAFGSENVDGVSAQAETIKYLEKRSLNELGMPTPGLQAVLSAIHTLDLFIRNDDRHLSNFLVKIDGEDAKLIALDFARSMFWKWPWIGFADPQDNTSQAWIEIRGWHGFDMVAAGAVLDRLGVISAEQLQAIIDPMPPHWLDEVRRNELLSYCRSGEWAARVDALRKGLENGSIV